MQSTNSSNGKVVLVTGACRGIGTAIAKSLIGKGFKVIITARTDTTGQEVFKNFQKNFPEHKDNIYYYSPLDISVPSHVEALSQWVKEKFGQIDVLFNNAGTSAGENELALKFIEENKVDPQNHVGQLSEGIKQMESLELFDSIFSTNVYGTANISETFLKNDLIKHNGKIITIASSTGNATRIENETLKKELTDEGVTVEQVKKFCTRYRKAIENGSIKTEGWIQHLVPVYSNSKLLTNIYSRALASHPSVVEKGIQVFACCPGWVRSDLGGQHGVRSLEQGAITPVYLVELEHSVKPELQGKFFYDCKPYDWINKPVPVFEEN